MLHKKGIKSIRTTLETSNLPVGTYILSIQTLEGESQQIITKQ